MTIDKAIKIADAISKDTYGICKFSTTGVHEFGALCADALRLAKKMSENAGISATPVQDTWQERMKCEYRETKERYEKLHRMVTKYEAGVLEFTPTCSIELLKQQKRHMGEYLHDLEIRSFVEGVEL